MSFLEFRRFVLKYGKDANVSVRKISHDEEKGLHTAFVGNLKITGNSDSRKVTIYAPNKRCFMATI